MVIKAPELLISDVFVLQTVNVNHNIFTRLTEKGPFYPPCIQKIIDLIAVGSLEPHKLQEVHDLVAEFTNIFALSVKEVKLVTHVKYQLGIPPNAALLVKVNQQSLTMAQKEFYFLCLMEFVEASVLKPIMSARSKWHTQQS